MKWYFCLILFSFFNFSLTAQIAIAYNEPYDNIDSLISLIIGEGVSYSNVTLNNNSLGTQFASVGYFDGSNSNIGIDSGIVISTKTIGSIQNGFQGSIPNTLNYDDDLEQILENISLSELINTSLSNLIILEFDFIPISDTVSFNYVFASDEYQDNVCSPNPDVFGFFLSGPGINGPFTNNAVNIALVPDPVIIGSYTNTPVNINSVNSGSVGNCILCQNDNCFDMDPNWSDYSNLFVNNLSQDLISVNGFTSPLSAFSIVESCQTYHMKIAISDVSDGLNGSSLFIEQNSFSSQISDINIDHIPSSNVPNIPDSIIYENCGVANIKFTRQLGDTSDVNISFKLSGTAQGNGIDYDIYSDSLTYQNGLWTITIIYPNNEANLEITTYEDNLNEGNETLKFDIDQYYEGCVPINDQIISFTIKDQPNLELSLTSDTAVYCPGDLVELKAQLTGGVGEIADIDTSYFYEWDHIGLNPIQPVFPHITSTYYVKATDICRNTILQDSVTIFVPSYPELKAESEIKLLCEYQKEELCVVNIEGGEGNYYYQWSNGDQNICTVDYPGEYSVTVSDNCGISEDIVGRIYYDYVPDPFFESLNIPHSNFGVEFNNYTEVNLYNPDYSLISNNNSSLDFSWDFGDGNFSNYLNCEHIYQNEGNYQVILKIISPIARCEKTYSEYINLKSDFYFYAPDVFTPNNDGLNDKYKLFVNGVRKFNLYVYDRYGNLVFETDKIDRTWDGTNKGKLLPQGNYSYKCLMVRENDIVEFTKFGSIKLIR